MLNFDMFNAERAEHIALFDSKLDDLLDNQNGKNWKFLSKQEYQEILDSLEKWEDLSTLRKKKIGYHIPKRYKILRTAETSTLIYASDSDITSLIQVTHQQRVEDLLEVHLSLGHSKGIFFGRL